MSWVKRHRLLSLAALSVAMLLLVAPTIYANASTKNLRYNLSDQDIPEKHVAIVLGAGVLPSGEPTPYLKMRIETAVHLYKDGKVSKLLVSGDNSEKNYNEPEVMRAYAETVGVLGQDIVMDYAGFNTYDTCYRAQAIFGVHEAIVITQGYHLPRAVITCNGLGIDTIGVAATKRGGDFTVTYIMREYVSTTKALLQLLLKPHPTVLGLPE